MVHSITVIGLGAGDFEQLTIGVYRYLKQANRLFLRTKEHPVVAELVKEGISFQSFDYIYEQQEQFADVYETIATILFEEVKSGNLVYALPGHPLVAEKTVQLLLEKGEELGVAIHIAGGQSFIDALFTAVKVDPIEGFQLLDGTALNRDEIGINQHIIIAQVYDAFIASEVKLTLMEKYPDDYPVFIVTGAGSADEIVKEVLLYTLDRQVTLNNLTSLYIPPVRDTSLKYREFATLREIIATLRGPNGCPWDQKQTNQTLKKYLIEEVYELIEAIDEDDIDHIVEELGDVLLQVLLHAQIGEDEGMFQIEDVIKGLSKKMISRHPHVFGDRTADTTSDVARIWEEIKREERGEEANENAVLKEITKGQPAIITAYEMQKKAGKVGFDWDEAREAWKKVHEEMAEFTEALANESKEAQIQEFGDLMFAMINVARLLSIHPEEALIMTNNKFKRRFSYIEKKVSESGRTWDSYDLMTLDELWDEAKAKGL